MATIDLRTWKALRVRGSKTRSTLALPSSIAPSLRPMPAVGDTVLIYGNWEGDAYEVTGVGTPIDYGRGTETQVTLRHLGAVKDLGLKND